ncbi:MAG TPA: invasion associated locus B family protein [Sphingobium sp.]|nr:invasion associated locus B family protein [Sphingobium sp.]
MITALTALALAASAAPAPATAAPEVNASETPFQAWILRCETRPDPKPPVTMCGLMSVVKAQNEAGQSAVLASIMLRPVPGADTYQLSFSLPLSVMLQPGARIADARDTAIVTLPFVACRAHGCEAGAVLTKDQLNALLASTEASSVSYDLQNRQTMKLAFSMAGFKSAFEALNAKR